MRTSCSINFFFYLCGYYKPLMQDPNKIGLLELFMKLSGEYFMSTNLRTIKFTNFPQKT